MRASIATVALIAMLVAPWSIFQISTIVAGGVAGWLLCGSHGDVAHDGLFMPVSRRFGIVCYRSGALVFGGGHVVLPLLRNAVVVPGWVSDGAFLARYGAAQAVPGPLFTVSA